MTHGRARVSRRNLRQAVFAVSRTLWNVIARTIRAALDAATSRRRTRTPCRIMNSGIHRVKTIATRSVGRRKIHRRPRPGFCITRRNKKRVNGVYRLRYSGKILLKRIYRKYSNSGEKIAFEICIRLLFFFFFHKGIPKVFRIFHGFTDTFFLSSVSTVVVHFSL